MGHLVFFPVFSEGIFSPLDAPYSSFVPKSTGQPSNVYISDSITAVSSTTTTTEIIPSDPASHNGRAISPSITVAPNMNGRYRSLTCYHTKPE